jgi:aspartate kinase
LNKWVVAKFGGSSVKDAVSMLRCSKIIESNPLIKIVVISATQNTTNQLEFVAQAAARGDEETLANVINELVVKHTNIAKELFTSPAVMTDLEFLFEEVRRIATTILVLRAFSPKDMDELYSLGERMSSLLISDLLRLRMVSKNIILIDARTIIKTNSEFNRADPQIDVIRDLAKDLIIPHLNERNIFVTQGFIGEDLTGSTTTLGREGSDYSAALFGEAIEASLVQIWTDVPGVASSDPRLVKDARFIPALSYDEATALATLGAKVLFPTTLMPTKKKDIPVFVGSSLDESLGGTLVTHKQDSIFKLKAVTLLKRETDTLISFVGSHLNLQVDLVGELKNLFGDLTVEFLDLTSVSISFKIINSDIQGTLLKAHEILVSKY